MPWKLPIFSIKAKNRWRSYTFRNYLQSNPCVARSCIFNTAMLVMAALVSSFIFDSICSKTLLPWTIDHPTEDDRMVRSYYEMVVSKQPAEIKEHLSDHILEEVRVGHNTIKNELDVGSTGIYLHSIVERMCEIPYGCIWFTSALYIRPLIFLSLPLFLHWENSWNFKSRKLIAFLMLQLAGEKRNAFTLLMYSSQ